jgi:hypothetical protein
MKRFPPSRGTPAAALEYPRLRASPNELGIELCTVQNCNEDQALFHLSAQQEPQLEELGRHAMAALPVISQ